MRRWPKRSLSRPTMSAPMPAAIPVKPMRSPVMLAGLYPTAIFIKGITAPKALMLRNWANQLA